VETITVALFLLLAVVVSGAFARMSPVLLPLPLVEIALGAAIASVADLGVELKPDIFFLLFLRRCFSWMDGVIFSATRERSWN
jgi:hypothetical protein